ncbi:gamma-glutamyltransferase family protein [Vreelandella utahensis]|uniref:gamma-glutamyltransferase family protein n=1 Tax=Vreelandella halophila TaxID=86177 RepID=UPI000986857C|nr:gamma-glutamyltransferase family protein [Halomonas utahensis]
MSNIAFTAPHSGAADIGLSLLRDGASAVDAMIAASAAIAVLYPHMNSLAGDGFWLVQRPGEAPRAIDACGHAAALASIDWYREQGCDAIPARGPLSALTLGGTLSGWEKARECCVAPEQRRPYGELLAPAEALARDGIEVTASLAVASEKVHESLADETAFRAIFAPEGRPLRQGEQLRNPDLAETLAHLARKGPRDFYDGELAETVAAELAARGSPIRANDLTGYEAQEVTPLSVRTRVGSLYNFPPPTQGLASLLILAIYDQLYDPQWSDADRVHTLVEATKQAFRVRDREVTDPARMRAPAESHLNSVSIGKLAAVVGKEASPWPWPAEPGDTVWMGCVDAEGTMVSFIQSVYWEFGSGVTIPGTGLVWNNRGLSFSLDADHRNALEPGYKPFHTLNPAFAVLDDGRRMSYGTMGGEGQPQTQAALFTRYLYDGLPLGESIARGRWLLGRTWGDRDDDLKLEASLARHLGDELALRGHRFKTVPDHSEMMGHAGAVVRFPDGGVTAASDPRSDGAAREGVCST